MLDIIGERIGERPGGVTAVLVAALICLAPLFSTNTAQAAGGDVVSVADYGAAADSGEDSAPAIIKAVDKAKELAAEGKNVTIAFPKGRYDIYPDKAERRTLYVSNTVGTNSSYKDKKIGILLEDTKNITVDGQGSDFVFHGKMTTFAAINSRNVTFKNFSVDFQVPTVIDLTVEKVDAGAKTATVYVPEEYNYRLSGSNIEWYSDSSPYTGATYWTASNALPYVQLYDTKTGLTVRGDVWTNPIFQNVTGITDAGNHRLVFSYSSMSDKLANATGISYQMRQTTRDHPGVFLWKDKDVTLKGIDFRFLHGFGVVGQSTDTITMDGLHFGTGEGTGRSTAGYADFVQMSGCKGVITVANSSFSNPHDDPINVHGTFLQVVEKISDTKIKVRYMHNETAGFPSFFVGDQVEFMTKGDMLPVSDSVRTVTAVDGPDGQGGDMGAGSGSLTDIVLTLDSAIPSAVAVNSHVVENITYTPEVNIHGNVFKETPTRGILVTTRKKVTIENNLFDGMGMAGIYISNDAQSWYESGPTRDVTIRGNTFRRSGSDAILVEPTNPTVSTTDTVHKNMTIEGNTFYVNGNRVLNAKSVSDLTFRDNKIYRENPDDTVTLGGDADVALAVGDTRRIDATASVSQVSGSRLFRLNGCKQVVFGGNTYDVGVKAGIDLANMGASEVNVSDDSAKVGADGLVPVTGSIAYVSDDAAVASVDQDGTITAVGEGETTVRTYVIAGARRMPGSVVNVRVSASTATAPTPGTSADPLDGHPSSVATLSSATIDGLSKSFDFKPGTLYYFGADSALTARAAFKATDADASVKATLNGKAIDATGADVKLARGRNVIEATVTATDGITANTYRFVIDRIGGVDTGLAALSVGGNAISVEHGRLQYTASTMRSKTQVVASSFDPTATLQLMRVNGSKRVPVGDAQQGSLTRDVTVYQGDNTFELDVTSGGSTVSYKVAVTGTDSVYASDLAWESATSGDPNTNPVRKDKSCGNNTITLWDGEKEQTFDKGIGTHAASRIVYDVSDLGAIRFEAYVGVDRELTGVDRDHANVDFQVMIDGEVVFEKTAMQHDTPMAKVSVDIPEGAKTITLAVGAGSETWGDHADWADARFVGVEMPEAPQVTGLAVTGEGVKDGKLDMTVGQSVGLGVTVTPEDAVDQSVTWTVAGDAVSVGEDGTVKALKAGTATVTVASVAVPSVTASVTVTVAEKADPDPDPKPDPEPDPDPTPKPDPDPDPNPNPGPGDEPGTTTPGDGQKPNTDKDADKNAGKDKNQSIAATGASIVPVGVLAVSMMAAGCALTGRKRRES